MYDLNNDLNKAINLHKTGKLNEAITIYENIQKLNNSNGDIHHLLGLALSQIGDDNKALYHMELSIKLSPNNIVFLNDFSDFLISLKILDKAENILEKIIQIDNNNILALNKLGTIYKSKKNLKKTVDCFTHIAKLQKNNFVANANAGLAEYEYGEYKKAIHYFSLALEINSNDSELYRLYGLALEKNGEIDKAIKNLKNSIKINPQNAQTWYNLANILRDTANIYESIKCYNSAINLNNDYLEARVNLAETLQSIGNTVESIDIYRNTIKKYPKNKILISNILMTLNYLDSITSEELYKTHKELIKNLFPTNYNKNKKSVNIKNKINIGYVSADFKFHSVATFLLPILKTHNKSRINIFLYSNVVKPDIKTAEFHNISYKWTDIFNLSDDEVIKCIREDKIDILVDLSGHTRENRLGIFANKTAPVQVSFLGYPNTTGLESIDFRISDNIVDSQNTQNKFTESLIRIPNCFLSYNSQNVDIKLIENRNFDINKNVVFGSFNNIAKISDKTIRIWSNLLLKIPNASLFLKSRFFDDNYVKMVTLKKFRKYSIDKNRIVLEGFSKTFTEHLQNYNKMDIALDTFPYNGTTTTCEALMMGVPVMTILGDRHASRVTASILNAVGLNEECVANTENDFIDKCIMMAKSLNNNKYSKINISQKVRNSILCDIKTYTNNLENSYFEMIKRVSKK